MRPITACSRHKGTNMAMRRFGARANSCSVGQGNGFRLFLRKIRQMKKSSSPLNKIHKAMQPKNAAAQ